MATQFLPGINALSAYESGEALAASLKNAGYLRIMWFRSDASGDLPHVVAALKSEPTLGVIVFDFKGYDKAKAIEGKLLSHGIIKARVRTHAFPDVDFTGLPELFKKLSKLTNQGNARKYTALIQSTEIVAKNSKISEDIKSSFRGTKGLIEEDKQFLDFWLYKGGETFQLDQKVRIFERHAVVLWGRWSGKRRKQEGPHPYGDSSTAGMIQIAKMCIEQQWTVILAGDISANKRSRFPAGCVFLGEFWNDLFWKDNPPSPSTMREQVRLFYALKKRLKEKGKRLVHAGMRSGSLDYYGFSGQRVIYTVPEGVDDKRISSLSEKFKWWTQSKVESAPKHAFTKWPPQLDQKLEQEGGDAWSQWKESIKISSAVNEEKDRLASYYNGHPLDTDSQIAIKLAYQFVKDNPKQENMSDKVRSLFESEMRAKLSQVTGAKTILDEERKKAGFGDNYLLKLKNQFTFALTGNPPSTEAETTTPVTTS